MSDIRAIIAEETERSGPMRFDRFMELALYCPDFGYYEQRGKPLGRSGDYFTSVSAGPLFGELLAGCLAGWLGSPAGAPQQILEAGAHDGQLAEDLLGWLQQHRPRVFDAIEYWILEPSRNRQSVQLERLRRFGSKVRWFESWDVLPADGVHGVILSNELLDAMPVRRAGWDAVSQEWFEWGVGLLAKELVWVRLPGDQSLRLEIASLNLPADLLRVLPDGFCIEIGAAARTWWRQAGKSLRRGKLLTFDYGLEREDFFRPERKDGTLRAYYRHHLSSDVLARPGEQDLTAHVNFSDIREAGEREGLATELFATQARFLTELAQKLSEADPAFGPWLTARARSFQTLTHPSHLGSSFCVLIQSK